MAENGLLRATALRYLLGLTGVAITCHIVMTVFGDGRDAGGIDVAITALGAVAAFASVQWVSGDKEFNLRECAQTFTLRVLPAFVVTLIAVAIATRSLLPRSRWPGIAQDTFASLLGFQNFRQLSLLSDAGSASPPVSPLAHLWAVSVALQLVAVWALVCLLLRLLNPGRTRSLTTSLMFGAGSLTAISIVFAVGAVNSIQEFAYLSPATRAWQFGLGAIAALVLLRRRTDPKHILLNVVGWAGLLVIIFAAVFAHGVVMAPGARSILTVLGTVLIILSARPNPQVDPVTEALGMSKEVKGWSVGRFLDSVPGRHVGRHAWELFLWHWPVLVFFLALRSHDTVDAIEAFHVVVITYALAGVTRFLVTRSGFVIRDYFPRTAVTASLASFLACVVIASAAIPQLQRAEESRFDELIAQSGEHPGALVGIHTSAAWVSPPSPSAEDAVDDSYSSTDWRCDPLTDSSPSDPTLVMCQVTPEHRGGPRVLVTGNAEVMQWIAPLETIASDYGWDLLVIAQETCRFADGALDPTVTPECGEWANGALYAAGLIEPELIITSGAFLSADDGHHTPRPDEAAFWQELRDVDLKVAVLATPSPSHPRSTFDKAVHESMPEGVQLIDVAPILCDGTGCPTVIGNVTVYRDEFTVTNTFANTAMNSLETLLAERYPSLMREGRRPGD